MRLHTGTVTRPRYESAPYRMHPGRRRHIYGALVPMDDPYGGKPGRVLMFLIAVAAFGGFAMLNSTPRDGGSGTATCANNAPPVNK